MSALAQLKLVTAKRSVQLSPVLQRRNKVSLRLVEQIALAQAKQDGRIYSVTQLRKVKDKVTGEVKTVEVLKRVKEWWFSTDSKKTCVVLKYGARTIEIAKGKTAVELGSESELVATLGILKKAVDEGELDAQIEAVAGSVKTGLKK